MSITEAALADIADLTRQRDAAIRWAWSYCEADGCPRDAFLGEASAAIGIAIEEISAILDRDTSLPSSNQPTPQRVT